MILKEMKVLDQEIAPPRPVAEERTHLVLREAAEARGGERGTAVLRQQLPVGNAGGSALLLDAGYWPVQHYLRLRIDLAPLREFTRPTAPGTWVNAARRLRAIRLATWWMMDVHSLSVTSDGFVIRLYVPAAPRSQGGLRPV